MVIAKELIRRKLEVERKMIHQIIDFNYLGVEITIISG